MTVLVQLPLANRSAPPAGELLALARDPAPDSRQRLLLGVLALCDASPPSGTLSPVLGEIFLSLAQQAEREVRRALAERVAGVDWAPKALVNLLARDEIEIARPVLLESPVLQDDDLLRVLIEASLEHQIAIARRPRLSSQMADAVIDRGEPAVLTALATNRSADVSSDALRRLVEHSRRIAALRGPLTRHPRLTQALAEEMCRWLGAALRQSIAARFEVDGQRLGTAVYDAVEGVLRSASDAPVETPERDEMERRLAAKLHSAGQLRAGVLVRAARERRLGLFVHGLALLGGFSTAQVRSALAAPAPEALYYACAAIGVDRAVFPSLLRDLRSMNQGLPGDEGAAVWLRGALSSASAARAFRTLVEPEPAGRHRQAV